MAQLFMLLQPISQDASDQLRHGKPSALCFFTQSVHYLLGQEEVIPLHQVGLAVWPQLLPRSLLP